MDPKQLSNLQDAARAAVLSEIHTGCPALLSISQWALESGFGLHSPGNNPFGIKAYQGCYGRQNLLTTEYIKGEKRSIPQWFATFATLYDAFEKHGELIAGNARYALSFQQYAADKDIEKLVRGIAPVYATDPNYSDEILRVMSMTEVLKAVGDAWSNIKQ